MTSRSAHRPRIRRTNYESNPVPAVVACPHCGGVVGVGVSASQKIQQQPDAETGAVSSPDAEPVRRQVAHVLRSVLEVIDGRRPAAQLGGTATPSACRYVRAARLNRAPGRVSRLMSVRVFLPADGAAEATAVVAMDGRVRAVAARFEQNGEGWRCTTLHIL